MKKLFILSLVLLPLALFSQQKAATYEPFNVGEIKPQGWLHDWCGMATRGLTKTLGEDFTEFVKGWESPDETFWWHYEQTGYYIDGVTRLAFIMDDTLLINRSKRVMESVLNRQRKDGYIMSTANDNYASKWGTTEGDYGMYWSEAVFSRAAIAYYEATGDKRVLEMLKNVYDEFPIFERDTTYPLSGVEMDDLRKIVGVENMLEISRLSGDRRFAERALKVMKYFESGYVDSWAKKKEFMRAAICHGVSYNESAKLCAAAYCWNDNPDYLAASVNAYEFLQNHFVLPHGANSSNEYLHGIGAFEAAEACDISDFMWSNTWMARATGDRRYGDRIEQDAFNALPTAVNAFFDHSVYTTAMNRIPGVHLKIRDDGQYYKVIHDPTCCSANINRALPNYVINMCMKNAKHELMMLTYGPMHLKSKDGKFDIEETTSYPFEETISFTINAIPQGETLKLRVPEWCERYEIYVNDVRLRLAAVDGFLNLQREWQAGDRVDLVLAMQPVLHQGVEEFADFNGTQPYWGIMEPASKAYTYSGFANGGRYAYVSCGPVVYGLSLQAREANYYELNEERWHEFRFALDEGALKDAQLIQRRRHEYFRWSKEWAYTSITVKANRVDWEPDKGDPKLPVETPKVLESNLELELIPMGCCPYRMSMFPGL